MNGKLWKGIVAIAVLGIVFGAGASELFWPVFGLVSLSAILYDAYVGGAPLRAERLRHRQEMQRLKLTQSSPAALQDTRIVYDELSSLREATSQYDLSLDQSLQRLERRLERLESRIAAEPGHATIESHR